MKITKKRNKKGGEKTVDNTRCNNTTKNNKYLRTIVKHNHRQKNSKNFDSNKNKNKNKNKIASCNKINKTK